MIRYLYNNISVLLFLCVPTLAQYNDLFSEKNTAEFAQFLFESNQYGFAAEEFERLAFLYPANQEYQLALLESYRYANECTKGINAFGINVRGDLSWLVLA